MVRLFTFSRSKRSDKKVSKTDIEENLPENWENLDDEKPRNRFKRPSEILKGMNVSLMSKMDELRVLPLSYTFDEIGSFFYDELEFFNSTESSSLFKYFYLEIVDKSQSLPIILLNKGFLLDKILEKYCDKFFQPICSRLLIALVRDCGQEIEDLFVDRIIPAIATSIKITDVSSVETGFKIFASALKFLMKDIQKNPLRFIVSLLASLIQIKNAYIRKFTSESIVFIISKIRQKEQLNSVVSSLFSLSLTSLGLNVHDPILAQNLDDFKATLLFMILRGDQGSISHAGLDLQSFMASLMSAESVESSFFKKTFNLLIENEYKFFKNRAAIDASKVVQSVYLEDYLTTIFETNPKSQRLIINLLSIFTEILLFGSGQRFTEKLEELSEKLLAKSRGSIVEETIIFLAKFIVVKKRSHSYCKIFNEAEIEIESIHTFLNNLFRRSTFKRVEIFKEFKKDKRDYHAELSAPQLTQDLLETVLEGLIKALSRSIKDKEVDMYTKSDIAILTCSLLEKNLQDLRFKLEVGVYASIKEHLFKSKLSSVFDVENSDDKIVYFLSLLRIIRFSQNYEADVDFNGQATQLLRKIEEFNSQDSEYSNEGQDHIDLERLEDEDYVKTFDVQAVNYSVTTLSDIKVLMQCEFIQAILSNPNATANDVQVACSLVEKLMLLKDNHTAVIKTLLLVKRAALALSKKQNKPVVGCVRKEGTSFVFAFDSELLQQKLIKFLWSEVPESRISCLKVLLSPKSQLYSQLMELDTAEIAFYKERELFLLSQQISTDVYYDKYTEEEMTVLFHFILGFTSFRISSLQNPLNQALSYVLFKVPKLFAYYLDHVVLSISSLPSPRKADSRISILWSAEVDVVDPQVRRLRLLDSLEKVLAEQGLQARLDGDKNTHVKGAKTQTVEKEEKESQMDTAKIQENRARLAAVYKLLQLVLKTEIAPHVLPALNLLFTDNLAFIREGERKATPIEKIIDKARSFLTKEFHNEEMKKKKRTALEKMKRLILGLKSSFTLSSFEHRAELSSYLLEVMKYPNEEIQALCLAALLKAKKDNKIIKQHAQMLTGLTSKDGFKENLMKMVEKLRTLTEMEREHLLPVLNAILYRRLVDRTGTNNRKRFKAQKDFIFDIAASFSEKEVDALLQTLTLAHGLPLSVTEGTWSSVSSSTVSLNRLMQFTEVSESLLKRLGSSLSHESLLTLGKRIADCLAFSINCLEALSSDKNRIASLVKLGKFDEDLNEEDEDVEAAAQKEEMDEESIEGAEEQEADVPDEDEVAIADQVEEEVSNILTPDDKITLLMLKYLKQIKQNSYKRIVQFAASFVELDFDSFYQNLMPIIKPSISNLGSKTLAKIPSSFRLLGVFSECELYKKYFFDYPFCFEALVSVINNKQASAVLYIETFEILQKLAVYGLTEENEDTFNIKKVCQEYLGSDHCKVVMKDPLTNEDAAFSSLGVALVRNYADDLVDALANLSKNLDTKVLKLIRASDLKNLNKKISEFSLFISGYCTEGASTLKFYEVTKKAWSVEYINKKTSKPFYKIDSAQELNAVQKEKEIASNMIKILGNFCAKVSNIDQIFLYYFLPMVSRLEDLKLRTNLADCYRKLIENPGFESLDIDTIVLHRLADLHSLAKSLTKVSLDYNKVVDFLIDVGSKFDSMSENQRRLIVANCLFWLTADEMSTREKSLSIILEYIRVTDIGQSAMVADSTEKDADFSNRSFYRLVVLETSVYFLQSHFGREHVMKYFTSVMKGHAIKSKNEQFADYVEFTDLGILVDEQNPENDFFDLIFNLKLVLRGQAVKNLKKLLKKKGVQFSPNTVKRFFAKVFDYYLYEYWPSANKEQNKGSNSRLDSVRHILESVFEVYGMLVGQLPFGNFIRFLKDKIFQLEGKSEQYSETTVKVICSSLNHVNSNLPDVLEKIKAEQEALNEQALKLSVMNRFLDAYKDQSEVARHRTDFDLNLPEKKDGEVLMKELAEMREEDMKEPEDLDEDEEEERIEKAALSDNQYRVLKLHILGPLKRFLCKKDEKESTKSSVRPDVAIAVVQVIRLFPQKVFVSELIGMLSKICGVLQDRDDERRKTARNTLVNLLKLLGPFFLGYFVKELAFHLKRGYEVHIRNYMIFKLLDTLVKPLHGEPIKCGQIDYVVPLIAPLLVDEICGDLDEEKEIKEIKTKTLEFKKNKGIESFKILAQKIDFKGDTLSQIINCFKENFMKYSGLHRVKVINSDARKDD